MSTREAITATKLKKFLSGPIPTKDQYLRAPNGLGVRRFKDSGKASFIVEAKVRGTGKARRITIGPAEPELLDQAKEKARVLVARLRSGEDVAASERASHQQKVAQRITVNVALDHMLNFREELKPATQRDYRSTITNHAGKLLNTRITELNIENIRRQLRKTETTGSLASAAKLRRSLSAVISFAITEYALPMSNPMSNIKGVARPVRGKEGFIPDNRIGRLIRELYALSEHNKTHGNYLLFVLFTGCRKSEAMQLKWDHIDWNLNSLTFRDTKNGRDHTLPITCLVSTLLKEQEQLRKGNSQWVFPGRVNGTRLTDVRKSILRHVSPELLWVPRKEHGRVLQVHDLRRTAATHMEGSGIPKERVSLILNHKGGDITDRYIQQNFDSIDQSLERYQTWLIRKVDDIANDGMRVRKQLLSPSLAIRLRDLGANPDADMIEDKLPSSVKLAVETAADYWLGADKIHENRRRLNEEPHN